MDTEQFKTKKDQKITIYNNNNNNNNNNNDDDDDDDDDDDNDDDNDNTNKCITKGWSPWTLFFQQGI